MAYISFAVTDPGLTDEVSSIGTPAVISTAGDAVKVPESRLGALEWSVVALARKDSLSSLRAPSRLATAMRAILRQSNPRLADERLEALRRMAVFAWHYSFQVPQSELRAFFDAGFTIGQYEAMMASIGATRRQDRRRH